VLEKDLAELGRSVEYYYDIDTYRQKRTGCEILIFCPFLGIETNIIKEIIRGDNPYIYWNLEQYSDGKIQNVTVLDEILFREFLHNAKLKLDYSPANISPWKKIYGHTFEHIPIPMGTIGPMTNNADKEHDLIFVGGINERRTKMLPTDTYIANKDRPIFHTELHEVMKRSKFLVNIGYFGPGVLARVRINEALCNAIMIISEYPLQEDRCSVSEYQSVVNFTDDIETTAHLNLTTYDTEYPKWYGMAKDFICKMRGEYLFLLQKYFKLKVAIIQINYGRYDKEPVDLTHIIDKEQFDWYYFTDSKYDNPGWQFIHQEERTMLRQWGTKSCTKARYVRYNHCNFPLLKEYDYIMHIDANATISENIVSNINNIIGNNPGSVYFAYSHALRNNISDEAEISSSIDKYNGQYLMEQVEMYNRHGPDDKLYECGAFIYKQCAQVCSFFMDWYIETIYWGTQDQLSFPHCLRKNNITPFILNDSSWEFGSLTGGVWDNKFFGTIDLTHRQKPENMYCVIFLYYEHGYKARENLDFFIKHGIHDNDDVHYYIVINGYMCSLSQQIPRYDNVTVIERDNVGHDYGGVSECLVNIRNNGSFNVYDRFIILNSTVCGPYLPPYIPKSVSWYSMFTHKLDENTKLSGTALNYVCGKYGSHVQSMSYCTDRIGMEILFSERIFGRDASEYSAIYNNSRWDFIFTLEVGMSDAIIKHGYKIGALYINDINKLTNGNVWYEPYHNSVITPLRSYVHQAVQGRI